MILAGWGGAGSPFCMPDEKITFKFFSCLPRSWAIKCTILPTVLNGDFSPRALWPSISLPLLCNRGNGTGDSGVPGRNPNLRVPKPE